MRNYSIGLDIGTASVGWVCLDENQRIMKYNNRFAWGTHEFEAAEVAEARRMKRGARRRYNRRKKRLQLTQALFIESIKEIDAKFFDESTTQHFWKNNNQFENRTLSETLKKLRMNPNAYPTMYHLRQALLTTNKKVDIRLIYLAIHNLVKYRGHFLNEGQGWHTKNIALDEQLIEILTYYNGLIQTEHPVTNLDEIVALLLNRELTKSDKQKQIMTKLPKAYTEVIKLIVGNKVSFSKLFPESDNITQYIDERSAATINTADFDEKIAVLTEEEHILIELVEPLYQNIMLYDLLQGEPCVAAAKVKSFKQYTADLRQLKELVNAVADEATYRKFFITPKRQQNAFKAKPDYTVLCELDRFNKDKKYEEKFYKNCKQVLQEGKVSASLTTTEKIDEVLRRIENEQFLVKQKGIQNASIPHQNNVYEAQQILRKQQAYYPQFTADFIQKVVDIIAFRIPYYIGPLVQAQNKGAFGWLVRQHETGNITPFNFEQVVDKAASAEAFITRMTNTCTYLKQEKVMPKNALLYQYFEVLNELNSVQIREASEPANRKYRLDPQVKIWLIDNVFKKYKIVTHKRLLDALKKYEGFDVRHKAVFGTQKEDRFASNLSTYLTLQAIVGDVDIHSKMLADIVEWATLFTEKDIFMQKVKHSYPQIGELELAQLAKLNFTGWGRLSQKLLAEVPINTNGHTVIEAMTQQNYNFMELLAPRNSNLAQKIEALNGKRLTENKKIQFADIEALAGSPALKRGIWRAIKIVEELTKIFGEPTHIMIEVAREEGKKKTTTSRQKLWQQMIKNKDIALLSQEAGITEHTNFRNQRVWLYILQHGKCLYTGHALDFTNLSNYDIDHILPRNFVKDDSIDNLALVLPEVNKKKNTNASNLMPLNIVEANQRYAMIAFWQKLKDLGLMSSRKYSRLMKEKFDDVDKEQFIARQLVETRQIIKNVKDLLQERFGEETTIHLVKAGIVSQFRKSLELPKERNYNNKHHAIDALLTTVLIQFIIKKYGGNFLAFNFDPKENHKKWSKIAQSNKGFFIFKQFVEERYPSPVTNTLVSANQYVTEFYEALPWQSTKKIGSSESAFYDDTMRSPKVVGKAKYTSPKASRAVQQGIKNMYVAVIEYTVKQKKGDTVMRDIFDIKVIDCYQNASITAPEFILKLVQETKKDVVSARLLALFNKYQKIMWNNHLYYIAAASELHNAKQLQLTKEQVGWLTKDDAVPNWLARYKLLWQTIQQQYENMLKMPLISKKVAAVIANNEEMPYDIFMKEVQELFKVTSAGPTRSDSLGSRMSSKFDSMASLIIDESITGLHYRRPKKIGE